MRVAIKWQLLEKESLSLGLVDCLTHLLEEPAGRLASWPAGLSKRKAGYL